MFSKSKEAYNVICSAFQSCTIMHPVDAKSCIGRSGGIVGIDYANGIKHGLVQLTTEIHEPVRKLFLASNLTR